MARKMHTNRKRKLGIGTHLSGKKVLRGMRKRGGK